MPKRTVSYTFEEISGVIHASGIKNSEIEKAIGLSNGVVGKILKGTYVITDEKFKRLKGYLELKKTDRQLSEFASTLSLRSVASAIQKEEAPDLPPKFNPKVEEIKSSIEGLTTADKIPPPAPKVPEWVQRVEKYCSKEGISPDDLIIAHKTLMSNFSPVEAKEGKLKDMVFAAKKSEEKPSKKFDLGSLKNGVPTYRK